MKVCSNKLFNINNSDSGITCLFCSHYCDLLPAETGICNLRTNIDGKLFSHNWGKVSGLASDPIEKKPFYHFKPGSRVLSFGTPGCNFKCLNCQNSTLSQSAAKDNSILSEINTVYPDEILDLAIRNHVDGIAYTYSEPTMFFDYILDIIAECRKNSYGRNLYHVFISNGYFSNEVLEIIKNEKLFDAVNIDLKFIRKEKYQKICKANPDPVLENIKSIFEAAIHLEVINLIIPGENDSEEDLNDLCSFLTNVSTSIPLHFSRFFPRYKMEDKLATPLTSLTKAKEIAYRNGIKSVYIGNADIKNASSTYCPNCKTLLVNRDFYNITSNKISMEGKCPECSELLYFVV